MGKQAVLMLAYGSPDSLDDMEAYLNDIRGGRPMSKEFVEEFRGRYAQIGGRSPLNERTFEQAEHTEKELRDRGHDVTVYVGMRHWKPWIKDTVAQMQADGVEQAVGIVMAPHYSKMSIGKYWDKVNEAQEAAGSHIDFTFVDSWCSQPRLLEAQEALVREALKKFSGDVRDNVKIVFSAHSLPARLLKMGDPYDDELQSNAKALVQRLGEVDWTFSYQSAAKTGEPWLGPQIEELVPDLAEQGYRHLLIAPIGFVCDHVEVLYDIDIGVQAIAKEHGVQVERIASMNSNPVFIQAVVDAVVEKLKVKGKRQK
ncbi:MAG: ferrochelatase [bacterium]|nr:ferrochelatase [bacterium]